MKSVKICIVAKRGVILFYMGQSLEKLVKEFLEYLQVEKNASVLTIRNYRHYLTRFLRFLAGGKEKIQGK